jgi:hypothetical protein
MLCERCCSELTQYTRKEKTELSISRNNGSHLLTIKEPLLKRLGWVIGQRYDITYANDYLIVSSTFKKGVKLFTTEQSTLVGRLITGTTKFPEWFRYELALSHIPREYYEVNDKVLKINIKKAVEEGVIKALPKNFKRSTRVRSDW